MSYLCKLFCPSRSVPLSSFVLSFFAVNALYSISLREVKQSIRSQYLSRETRFDFSVGDLTVTRRPQECSLIFVRDSVSLGNERQIQIHS